MNPLSMEEVQMVRAYRVSLALVAALALCIAASAALAQSATGSISGASSTQQMGRSPAPP